MSDLPPAPTGLRLVSFNNVPIMYNLVRQWAARRGHDLRLVITSPGPSTRRTQLYREIVNQAPPEQDILITTHPKRLRRLIEAQRPDLIVSASFPFRLPTELFSLPTHGAVNLHPALLPRWRGPNPLRQFYHADPLIGATLHWLDAEFDTGAILSQQARPLPETLSREAVFGAFGQALGQALDEGVARAVAGAKGTPQDHSQATYAAEFSDADRQLDWTQPARTLWWQATALSSFGPVTAPIGGESFTFRRLSILAETSDAAAGTIVGRSAAGVRVAVGDGVVELSE